MYWRISPFLILVHPEHYLSQSPSSVGLSAFELLARWYDERKPKAFLSSEGKGLKMEGVSEVLADMSSVVRPMNIKGHLHTFGYVER